MFNIIALTQHKIWILFNSDITQFVLSNIILWITFHLNLLLKKTKNSNEIKKYCEKTYLVRKVPLGATFYLKMIFQNVDKNGCK